MFTVYRRAWECHVVQTPWAAGLVLWTVTDKTSSILSARRPVVGIYRLWCTLLSLTLNPTAKLSVDEPSCQQTAQDMELVISYYCKTRNLRYSADYGWQEILLVLTSLHMSKADLFNCFYAIVAKYIPRYVHNYTSNVLAAMEPSTVMHH